MENTCSPVTVPVNLGFDPKKFPSFRENQLETAIKVSESDKTLILVEAPTGTGKSLSALTAHRLMGQPRSAYVVSTKQLQDQIEADFHSPVVKGRNNFPCLHFQNLFPDITSEICQEYLGGDECEFEVQCPYLVQKRAALASPICVLNYPLFFTESNYVGAFSGLSYLIMDEVDAVEDHLMNFVEVTITPYLVGRIGIGSPKYKTKLESWREWTGTAYRKLSEEVEKTGSLEGLPPVKLKSFLRLKRAKSKLGFLASQLDEGWVMEQEKTEGGVEPSITFKPVKVDRYAKSHLWKHTSKALGMSATIMGHYAMGIELGLNTWDVDFIALPSIFPIDSRRVEYIPVANVTHKTKTEAYPEIVGAVDALLKRHSQDKVLVHAVNYELATYLRINLYALHHSVMDHGRANRTSVLEEFKSYPYPAVLISPSMERGVDLPGDLCRVIIVAKVPYPDLSSPQVNRRLYGFADGSMWYARRAARSLVQMTGRATRFPGDWSISYILDEQFGHLVSRSGGVFPSWWREAVRSGSI